MRRVYVALSGLLLAAVVAQFYFAAVGAFARPQDDSSVEATRTQSNIRLAG